MTITEETKKKYIGRHIILFPGDTYTKYRTIKDLDEVGWTFLDEQTGKTTFYTHSHHTLNFEFQDEVKYNEKKFKDMVKDLLDFLDDAPESETIDTLYDRVIDISYNSDKMTIYEKKAKLKDVATDMNHMEFSFDYKPYQQKIMDVVNS